MISRMINATIAIMFLLLIMLPNAAAAADEARYSLSVNNVNPKIGEEITVVVQGENLRDVFGFEINVSYNPTQLRFNSSSNTLGNGFAITPIVKDGVVTYAFTKVGASTASVSGKAELVVLKFSVLGAGESDVLLTRIKTVTKNQVSGEFTPKTSIHIIASGSMAEYTFKDVPDGYWAKQAIGRAAALGFVKGYPDGTFKPQQIVTRSEFATMLVRALDLPISDNAAPVFKDDARIGAWAKPYVAIAASNGLITGFTDGTFRPNNPVTRAEMTVMVVRALGLRTDNVSPLAFADSDRIPSWAKPSIAAAFEAGIVKGRGNNKFVHAASANRAEAVTLILSIVDYKNEFK